ncbi:MAG: hypothetical protein O7G30_18045, partial [Proteobacteria bacterium]|nr:hypothetical protein [Pseudomonadota bacterium]
MTRTGVLTLVCATALLSAPAPAHAQDDEILATLLGSEAEARGDADAWLAELLEAVAKHPASPYAFGCLWKIRDLAPSATKPETVEAKLEPVLARGVCDAETDELIRAALRARARARGDIALAASYRGARGYLRHFGVIGPFGDRNAALLHKRYPPEDVTAAFTEPVRAAGRMIRWRELPVHGDTAWVNPQYRIRDRNKGVVYAVARVRASKPGTMALKVWCSDSFKVAVNGRTVIVADRDRHRVPSVVWGTARIETGWNRILVKVVGDASFAIKAADPATGMPYEGLEEGKPFGPANASSRAPATARSYRTPWERARERVAGGVGTPAATAAAAFLTQWEGREWVALGLWERAARGLPKDESAEAANIRAGYGRLLASVREYPQVHRKLLAREQFELALKHFPHHDSAFVRLARYENDDDRPDRAVSQLKEHVEKRPTATAAMALAKIAKARGWEKEALDAARRALSVAPNHVAAIEFLAGYDKKYGNYDALLERAEQRLRVDQTNWNAWNDRVNALLALGQDEAAIAIWRTLIERNPTTTWYRQRIASMLRSRGRYDDSLAAWRALEKMVPEEPRFAAGVGEILEIQGDAEGAKAAYRRSLAAPYQPRLWRVLSRLEKREFDFAKAWEPDLKELLDRLPPTEELKKKYPQAVAITVLDHSVARVNDDGSAVTFVRLVFKLLDEKGVQKYHDVQRAGEMLEIRAILPDGTVMLPTGLKRRAFNMEGLVPGTVIDHRFVTFQAASPRGGYDGGEFFFQDGELRNDPNPVLLSRLVVIAPKGMKLQPVARNFDGEPQTKELDDAVATVWEKRDMPRITAEYLMPPNDEVIPLVDYSRPEDFGSANWKYLGERKTTWPTPLLEDALADALAGATSDREKLEAIYRYVNTEITGDRGTSRYPSGILMEKAGNRAQLFEALVRTAGIAYRTGRAQAWNGIGIDLKRPDASAFKRRFLWLMPKAGDPIAHFMGPRLAPFGLVPAAYRGSAVFL